MNLIIELSVVALAFVSSKKKNEKDSVIGIVCKISDEWDNLYWLRILFSSAFTETLPREGALNKFNMV